MGAAAEKLCCCCLWLEVRELIALVTADQPKYGAAMKHLIRCVCMNRGRWEGKARRYTTKVGGRRVLSVRKSCTIQMFRTSSSMALMMVTKVSNSFSASYSAFSDTYRIHIHECDISRRPPSTILQQTTCAHHGYIMRTRELSPLGGRGEMTCHNRAATVTANIARR